MKFEKIYEGRADCAKTFELINRGYSPDVFRAGQWFEIEAAEYWYFLEVMPPLDMLGGAFSMSEFATGTLTNAFYNFGERYFCLTISRENRADFDLASRWFAREVLEGASA